MLSFRRDTAQLSLSLIFLLGKQPHAARLALYLRGKLCTFKFGSGVLRWHPKREENSQDSGWPVGKRQSQGARGWAWVGASGPVAPMAQHTRSS